MSFKVTVQRLREMGPKKLGRSSEENFYRNCFNDARFGLKKGKLADMFADGPSKVARCERCLDRPDFILRTEIFHCKNTKIYRRKGSKWILVMQRRHLYEIL